MTRVRSPERAGVSTYLQIYPSTLVGASRMEKIARSLHPHIAVESTELVGVQAGDLPAEVELTPGVKVVRIGGSDRSGNLGRVLRHVLWQPRVYRHYRNRNVVAVAAHNVWVLPLAHLISKRADAPLIYNPHELETRTASMHGFKRVAATVIEKGYIHKCALISVVNDLIGDWYATTYGVPQPIPLPNFPEDREVATNVRGALGVGVDEMLYVHTGHLSEGRNIPAILDAFRSSDHHVLFLGDGAYRNDILAASREHSNIHWQAPVEADTVVSHVREADAGLCLIELQGSLSDQLATPNKLMEALAADRPALSTDFPEARRWLAPHESTWILDDVAGLSGALARITQDDVLVFRHTHHGLPTWDEQVAALSSAYQGLLGVPSER